VVRITAAVTTKLPGLPAFEEERKVHGNHQLYKYFKSPKASTRLMAGITEDAFRKSHKHAKVV
jgi:hypothetical protein